jgi:hypothetical protein
LYKTEIVVPLAFTLATRAEKDYRGILRKQFMEMVEKHDLTEQTSRDIDSCFDVG